MIVAVVWSWMVLLNPDTRNVELAQAIGVECSAARPLFRTPDYVERCASLMTAIAFRETAFEEGVRGDHGASRCVLQIQGDPTVERDSFRCVRVGIERVRESMSICQKGNELCIYAAGPRGLTVSRDVTEKITEDRMMLAKWLRGAHK